MRLRSRLPLACLALVLLVPIGWGMDASWSWDVDNIAPGSVLRAMEARFGPGWHSSYGPVPYELTAIVYAPMLLAMRVAGELGRPAEEWPFGFRHPDAAIAALIVAARLVNVLLALGIAALAMREGARAAPAAPAADAGGAWTRPWIVAAALAGSAVFVYYARTSNVDMVALFWAWLAFALAEPRGRSVGRYAGAAAAAALAIATKEQIAPFAAVAGLLALARAWRAEGRLSGPAGAALVVVAGALAYLVAWGLPFNASGWVAHHRFLFETAKYPRTYPATPAGFAALGGRTIAMLPFALGLPVTAGLLLAILVRPRLSGLGPRAIAAALYLVFFVASIGYVYPRFLLPLLVLALPVAVRATGTALERARPAARMALAAALLVLALPGGPVLDLVMLRDTRAGAGRWLSRNDDGPVEIAGNPHYQPHLPRSVPVVLSLPESLVAHPRGPRGERVLLSSLDQYQFRREPLRSTWADSLEAGWRLERVFAPPRIADAVQWLPVSPTIQVYARARTPAAAEGAFRGE